MLYCYYRHIKKGIVNVIVIILMMMIIILLLFLPSKTERAVELATKKGASN